MDKYYLLDERDTALYKAINEINIRANINNYTRGYNDCFAFLALYDEYLRGESRAYDKIKFKWNSVLDFQEKLAEVGYNIKTYLEYCGYEILRRERPIVGDVAFIKGAMIYNGDFWVSPTETNQGISEVNFNDPRKIHARPIRS